MTFLNTRFKKTVFGILVTIVILVTVIIVFISPVAKYVVEKYDVKYSGREITMDLPYINPFTGYVHLRNLKIYEPASDSVFFSTSAIKVNFEMLKLLSKTYEISSLTVDKPIGKIIQNDSVFNFSDLIAKFSKKDTLSKKAKKSVHFNILDVKIIDGTFYYIEKTIPVFYSVKKVNIDTKGKKWDQDTIAINYDLESGIGTGSVKGNATINVAKLDYRLNVLVNKFDLSVMEQYLKDISNYGKFRGNLDADIKASGNIKSKEALNAVGVVSINDLHYGKDTTEDYLAFKKLTVGIMQLNPAEKKYSFDSISLLKPYFKYERYDHLDNLQNMFGKGGKTIKEARQQKGNVNILFRIADYVKVLAKNFFKSNYKINKLGIYDADIKYNDYALNEKFSVAVSPLTILADSIERSVKWVDLTLKTGLKPYGDINFRLSINPKDSTDFDIHYHLQKIPLAMFNPYLITFTSFPTDRGTIELIGNWNVRNGYINSNNRLTIIDARIGNKQKRNGAKWIPLKLIMFFIRDRGNVTDYEVPIKGNLKDPKFKLGDVILDVITNIFVKPATTPYRTEIRSTENEIEKSMLVRWDKRKSNLESDQEEFVEKMATFLKEHPNVSITVNPLVYEEKEKEYILFFEAKKQFYLFANKMRSENLKEHDSLNIEKISVKDSTFIRYLDSRAKSKLLFTIQDKCRQIVSEGVIDEHFNAINKSRKEVFLSYFKKDSLTSRVKLLPVIYKIPYNGFSVYRINYKGEIPDELLEAYRTINKFDNESPRKKYKRLREKNRKAIRGK
ncbi:MAG: DUF748 domain-containing protein [Bacteroidota bacterium]